MNRHTVCCFSALRMSTFVYILTMPNFYMLHFFLRYESPIPPNVEIMQYSIAEAIPMAVVGFAVAFSVAKVYADKHDYVIDGSQVRDRVTFVCKKQHLHLVLVKV